MKVGVGNDEDNGNERAKIDGANNDAHEEKVNERLPDAELWKVFDINCNGFVSLHDLAAVLFFSGLAMKMPRSDFKAVLSEMHRFKLGKIHAVPKTRAAFAKLCKCDPDDVGRHLKARVDKGYKREVESCFDGNTFYYLRYRLALWCVGFTTYGLRSEFFSQEVADLVSNTPLFETLGYSAFGLLLVPAVVQAALFAISPSVRAVHSVGELIISFTNYLFFGLGMITR